MEERVIGNARLGEGSIADQIEDVWSETTGVYILLLPIPSHTITVGKVISTDFISVGPTG